MSRLTPFGLFVTAFISLLVAAAAVGVAQFYPGAAAPLLSIGFSVAAAVCTLLALLLDRGR